MKLEPNQLVELNFPTEALGVWGHSDWYYGMALKAKIVSVEGDGIYKAQMVEQGFYGMSDSPEAPIRGGRVFIMIDTKKVTAVNDYGDRKVLEFRP